MQIILGFFQKLVFLEWQNFPHMPPLRGLKDNKIVEKKLSISKTYMPDKWGVPWNIWISLQECIFCMIGRRKLMSTLNVTHFSLHSGQIWLLNVT